MAEPAHHDDRQPDPAPDSPHHRAVDGAADGLADGKSTGVSDHPSNATADLAPRRTSPGPSRGRRTADRENGPVAERPADWTPPAVEGAGPPPARTILPMVGVMLGVAVAIVAIVLWESTPTGLGDSRAGVGLRLGIILVAGAFCPLLVAAFVYGRRTNGRAHIGPISPERWGLFDAPRRIPRHTSVTLGLTAVFTTAMFATGHFVRLAAHVAGDAWRWPVLIVVVAIVLGPAIVVWRRVNRGRMLLNIDRATGMVETGGQSIPVVAIASVLQAAQRDGAPSDAPGYEDSVWVAWMRRRTTGERFRRIASGLPDEMHAPTFTLVGQFGYPVADIAAGWLTGAIEDARGQLIARGAMEAWLEDGEVAFEQLVYAPPATSRFAIQWARQRWASVCRVASILRRPRWSMRRSIRRVAVWRERRTRPRDLTDVQVAVVEVRWNQLILEVRRRSATSIVEVDLRGWENVVRIDRTVASRGRAVSAATMHFKLFHLPAGIQYSSRTIRLHLDGQVIFDLMAEASDVVEPAPPSDASATASTSRVRGQAA
ncbi:MAG: hypothetical protein AB8G96_04230 [Phycisphaerales bacterium]